MNHPLLHSRSMIATRFFFSPPRHHTTCQTRCNCTQEAALLAELATEGGRSCIRIRLRLVKSQKLNQKQGKYVKHMPKVSSSAEALLRASETGLDSTGSGLTDVLSAERNPVAALADVRCSSGVASIEMLHSSTQDLQTVRASQAKPSACKQACGYGSKFYTPSS